MAGGLLFATQALLDSWAGQGKIEFVGNVMTLLQGEGKGRSYALEPAVRFLKVIGADEDPHKLLAKVKQTSQLREMGAEQLENSVIVGDSAYEVEPGFLAEASALQAAYAARPGDQPPKAGGQSPRSGAPVPVAPVPPQAAQPLLQGPSRPPPLGAAKPAAAAHARPGSRPAPLPRDLEEKRKEAEALARFLLDNLS